MFIKFPLCIPQLTRVRGNREAVMMKVMVVERVKVMVAWVMLLKAAGMVSSVYTYSHLTPTSLWKQALS